MVDPTAAPVAPAPKRYIQYGFGSGPGKSIAVPEVVYQLVKRLVEGRRKV